MSTANETCTFLADMMVRTAGGGYSRIRDVRCIRAIDHAYENGEGRDHEFLTDLDHTFGATKEKGRWVTRR